MAFEQLKKPPLVEAILEVKWRVKSPAQSAQPVLEGGAWFGQLPEGLVDPAYDLLVGYLFDRLKSEYPFHERLPSAMIPADIAPFLVQHRFRTGENMWPLMQIGPGIVTLNDTENYLWSDFSQRAVALVNTILEIHPQKSEIVVESLLLRYIDAEPFDYSSASVLEFLRERLKVSYELPYKLFEGQQVGSRPDGVNFLVVYPSARPKGTMQLRVATGGRHNQRAIIWETAVLSRGEDVPNLPQGIRDWLEAAHTLTHDWFFKLIEGELLRRYSGSE